MPEKQVWYPGRSRAAAAAESVQSERGRGSHKVLQTASSSSCTTKHPQAPHADKRKKAVHESPSRQSPSGARGSYSTVERGDKISILDYSTLSNFSNSSEFSGWQDEELIKPTGVEMTGVRNGMMSRLDTRTSQRRREDVSNYQFTHLLECHEHMDHYRTHYSYTTLACAPQSPSLEPDLVDQGQQALLKLEVRSLYRGDPFLMELASRLGVGDSIREPQLLTPHRHTAPSIVKKPRNKSDIVIDLTPKPRYDEEEDDICSPGVAWTVQDSTKCQTPHPLELPRITELPNNSSTISINKYLRVNCQGEESEGSVLPNVPTSGTHLSSTSDVTTDQLTESTPYERHSQLEEVPANKANPLVQNKLSLHTLNKAQKEKLITATAHLLGLSSRKWASQSKRHNHYLDYSSRPGTRQRKEKHNKQQSRPATRQETKKPINETRPAAKYNDTQSRPVTRQKMNETHTRPPTRQETNKVSDSLSPNRHTQPRTKHKTPQAKRPQSTLAPRHKEKLDRLKSIYAQSSSSTPSHPHTRLHTRPKEVDQDVLDGSSYWNDLRVQTSPKKGARKNETKKGAEMPTSNQSKSLSVKVVKKQKKANPLELTPGSTPLEIARHIARFKQKFDSVLNVQIVS